MDRVSLKKYCDKKTQGDVFSSFSSRGKAFVCSVAYPTEESRSEVACEKLCGISTDSFIRRPSLKDEAMETIAGFINEGIHLYQEPDKVFLCSGAILYSFCGKARCIATGNSKIYHFQDGGMAEVSGGSGDILFGKRVRWEQKAAPEFELMHGNNIFLLCSGTENTDFDEIIRNLEQEGTMAAAEGALHASDYEEWLQAIIRGFHGKKCSAVVLVMPEAKRSFLSKWGRGQRERRGYKSE